MHCKPTLESLLEEHASDPKRLEHALALAQALASRDRVGDAIAHLEKAAQWFPYSARPWSLSGDILSEAGHNDAAISSYAHALELNCGDAQVCSRAGNLCQNEGRREEAAGYFRKLFELTRSDPDAYRGLARTVADGASASEIPRKVRALCGPHPDEGALLAGVGWALFELGRYGEARDSFRKRLREAPDDQRVLLNLARAEDCAGNYSSARSLFEDGLSAPEPLPDLVRSYVEHLIRTGGIEDAKALYRAFLKRAPRAAPSYETPDWRGEPLAGKTILIQNDGGLGDTIQFVRFTALLKQLGAQTIVECQPKLVELVASCAGVDLAVAPYSRHPSPDYTVKCQFLGLLLDWTWDSLRRHLPYLTAPRVQAPGPSSNGTMRVGIAWHGNQLWRCDPNRYRSLPLTELAPLAAIPGVDFFSLQFGTGMEQTETAPFRVHQLEARGLSATAASVESLDLVVSIDTAVAHLACALGKPCFILLPFVADWRWMQGHRDYPFYPTARLFRQSKPGVWTDVVSTVADAVARFSRKPASTSHDANSPRPPAAAPF